jgi:hypothetical protein
VDLGYEKGKQKFATYKNGNLTVGTESSSGISIGSEDCKWLYNTVYKQYVLQANPCNKKE